MQVGVIGVNHKSADLALREQLARVCQRYFGAGALWYPACSYVLVSTCNRCELYFTASDLAGLHTHVLGMLQRACVGEFTHNMYAYFGRDCFFHLACVTAGIDSALLCETEIQHQVKTAYEQARTQRFLAAPLHFLFQKSLMIGKQVRTLQTLTPNIPTREEAVLRALAPVFEQKKAPKVLFVGLSDMNRQVWAALHKKHTLRPYFCNRSEEKISAVLGDGVEIWPWSLLALWPQFDVAIFGTKAPQVLATSYDVQRAGVCPALVIDLSVPRNVEPSVGTLCPLLNSEQLHRRIQRLRTQKLRSVAQVETQSIRRAVDTQMALLRQRQDMGRKMNSVL